MSRPETIVYTLELCYPYEGCTILGVFSSEERAEAHKEYLVTEKKHYRSDLSVCEFTVDALSRQTENLSHAKDTER